MMICQHLVRGKHRDLFGDLKKRSSTSRESIHSMGILTIMFLATFLVGPVNAGEGRNLFYNPFRLV